MSVERCVCGGSSFGKEESLKETHQGCLSHFNFPFHLEGTFPQGENGPGLYDPAHCY